METLQKSIRARRKKHRSLITIWIKKSNNQSYARICFICSVFFCNLNMIWLLVVEANCDQKRKKKIQKNTFAQLAEKWNEPICYSIRNCILSCRRFVFLLKAWIKSRSRYCFKDHHIYLFIFKIVVCTTIFLEPLINLLFNFQYLQILCMVVIKSELNARRAINDVWKMVSVDQWIDWGKNKIAIIISLDVDSQKQRITIHNE